MLTYERKDEMSFSVSGLAVPRSKVVLLLHT